MVLVHWCVVRHVNSEVLLTWRVQVERTATILPDLAKEAFLFAQVESLQQKDAHAKQVVKQCSEVRLDGRS